MSIARVRNNSKKLFSDAKASKTERAVYILLNQGAAYAAVRTPVDTGTLINSQYAPRIAKTREGHSGHVGYTAAYAGAVHEAPGVLKGLPRPNNRGNHWDPSGEPRFLAKGMQEVMRNGMAVLRRTYAI